MVRDLGSTDISPAALLAILAALRKRKQDADPEGSSKRSKTPIPETAVKPEPQAITCPAVKLKRSLTQSLDSLQTAASLAAEQTPIRKALDHIEVEAAQGNGATSHVPTPSILASQTPGSAALSPGLHGSPLPDNQLGLSLDDPRYSTPKKCHDNTHSGEKKIASGSGLMLLEGDSTAEQEQMILEAVQAAQASGLDGGQEMQRQLEFISAERARQQQEQILRDEQLASQLDKVPPSPHPASKDAGAEAGAGAGQSPLEAGAGACAHAGADGAEPPKTPEPQPAPTKAARKDGREGPWRNGPSTEDQIGAVVRDKDLPSVSSFKRRKQWAMFNREGGN